MLQKFPQVSFVISTRNRCEVLLQTLAQVIRCGLEPSDFDIHVIDNASTDGTSARVRDAFPRVRLRTLSHNRGSVAKNEAIPHALGRYIVFLDDDSYPIPGAIEQMIRHFEADPKLGAATFTVTLPNGRRECSAYPDVFIGCGVGLRRRALRAVGFLPDDFFMQAEEYDLSLRLIDAGYRVRTFDDLHVTHLKTPRARVSSRTMRLDVRNNLLLVLRRFPLAAIVPYGRDWLMRYWWIATSKGAEAAFVHGLIDGMLRSLFRPRREAVSDEAFEQFARLTDTRRRLAMAVFGKDVRRVLLVDVGKNIHAYWRACRDLGLEVVAIADANLHHPSRRYRGIRVMNDDDARSLRFDLAIVANLSPVHSAARLAEWRANDDRPVVDLFEPDEQPAHVTRLSA